MRFQPVELGDRVRDPITGFCGIATAITIWLNGCIRIAVQPEKLDKDGKPREDRYFDQGALVVLKKSIHRPITMTATAVKPETRRSPGGPERESGTFRR